MAHDSAEELSQLRLQLDEVSRREAAFRLQTVREYVGIEARQRELDTKVNQLNAYVHQLHLERDALRAQVQAAHADVEAFVWMLQEAERDATALQALRKSAVWPLVSGLARPAKPSLASADVKAGQFEYFLHTSPYRLFREPSFTLRGWVLPRSDQAVTGIRVSVGAKTFHGRTGLEEPEVINQRGAQAKNPRPGFDVTFELTPGRHEFSLEAQLDNTVWEAVLRAPVWCRLK